MCRVFDNIFKAIREASGNYWSKGVESSRLGRIYLSKPSEDEISLIFTESGKHLHRRVKLWPSEEDWQCDCGDDSDPCIHVVSSAILYKRAIENDVKISNFEKIGGHILYCLVSKNRYLEFYRFVKDDSDKTHRISASLEALTTRRVPGPFLIPTKEDYVIDEIIKDFREGEIPANFMPKLLTGLSSCKNVLLDDSPVICSTEKTGYIATIKDDRGGLSLTGSLDSSIIKSFRNEAVLVKGNILKSFRAAKLPPRVLKMLVEGERFSLKEIPDLVSKFFPQLEKLLELRIVSKNIPKGVIAKPRIVFENRSSGKSLYVTPRIVYGKPIIARLLKDRLEANSEVIPVRKFDEERALITRLNLSDKWNLDQEVLYESESAVNLVSSSKGAIEWSGDAFKEFITKPSLELSIALDSHSNSGLNVEFNFSNNEDSEVDAATVVGAYERGESMIPLLGGGWAPLPKDWLSKYGFILKSLIQARTSDGVVPSARAFDVFKLADSIGSCIPDSLNNLRNSLANGGALKQKCALPSDLVAKLRLYQHEGVSWLNFMKQYNMGCLLADDMGLGKTLQSICILEKRSLVVAPTSVIYNWENEIKRFRPSLSICVYHGQKRVFEKDKDIVLTTYALLRQDIELFSAEEWKVCILDEAQSIKNPGSQVAKSAYTISANFRVALTGTPIENHLEDLWSQFNFLNMGLLGDRKAFQENYVKPISQGKLEVSDSLRSRVFPFLLRRIKSEVASDLPLRTDSILYCDLSEEERTIYDSLLLSTRSQVVENLEKGASVIKVLELLLRLRQASCHPALIPGQRHESSAKTKIVVEALKECIEGGHKSLVFSQWTSYLDLIQEELERNSVPFLRIDGSTRDRASIVKKFQDDQEVKVLLLSLKAAGTGLNLTSADHVFIMDPWWNPAVEEQAADRAHRIGQDKPVMVYRLVTKNTIEEKILLLKDKKSELSKSIISGANAARLTRDDLIALISD